MIDRSDLPYESIGRVTVIALAIVVSLITTLVVFVIAYAIYYRGLSKLINVMWRGYDIHGEHPPRWRREIAIYASALQKRDFSNVEVVREKLKKHEGRDSNEETV